MARLASGEPANNVELVELKVLVDAYVRQGRLLNETNDTITVLHAKLGRLDSASEGRGEPRDQRGDQDDAGQWHD